MTRGAGVAALLLGGCAAAPPPAPPPTRPVAVAPTPAAPAPATPPAAPRVRELRNAGFEAEPASGARCATGWDCTVHNHPGAFRFYVHDKGASGSRRSQCVERVMNEPWALVTQAIQDGSLRGTRVRLSMDVQVEGVTGDGAGAWALVQGNPPVHMQRLVRGSSGWQRVAVDLTVPANATVVEVGATLEGPGRACFDDVRLEVRPPP